MIRCYLQVCGETVQTGLILNKLFFNQQRYILLLLKSTGQHNDLEDALALDSCIFCNISVFLQVVVLALQPEPI